MIAKAVPIRPVLYSFRRCPYAMRARMALAVANVAVEIREVSLRDKPPAMLAASPKATVPVLVLPGGQVLDESLDIMQWALARNDPENWLGPGEAMDALIAANDGPFKFHLDRAKYSSRYPGADPGHHREAAVILLMPLEERLVARAFLCGSTRSLADIAIFPFIRQLARSDATAFGALPLPRLQAWLATLESSTLYQSVMGKLALWEPPREAGQ